MALIRLFYVDDTGSYNTGLLDTSQPAGRQCLTDPDPKAFPTLEDMLFYSQARGESIQEVASTAQADAMCSGNYVSPYALQQTGIGPGCCCPPGGGIQAPQLPPGEVFGEHPGETQDSFQYQRGLIQNTWRKPINTVSTS